MRALYWAAGAAGAAGVIGLVLGLKGAGIDPATWFDPGVLPPPRRSPEDILAAVAAVNPAGNPTLQRGYLGQPNWCNRFAHLVCEELGVPLIWGEYGTRANDQISWLDAGNGGWLPVATKLQAQELALQGYVVLATYYNLSPGESGHMALVLPYSGAVQIAQAGRSNFNRGSLAAGFGQIQPVFYAHA